MNDDFDDDMDDEGDDGDVATERHHYPQGPHFTPQPQQQLQPQQPPPQQPQVELAPLSKPDHSRLQALANGLSTLDREVAGRRLHPLEATEMRQDIHMQLQPLLARQRADEERKRRQAEEQMFRQAALAAHMKHHNGVFEAENLGKRVVTLTNPDTLEQLHMMELEPGKWGAVPWDKTHAGVRHERNLAERAQQVDEFSQRMEALGIGNQPTGAEQPQTEASFSQSSEEPIEGQGGFSTDIPAQPQASVSSVGPTDRAGHEAQPSEEERYRLAREAYMRGDPGAAVPSYDPSATRLRDEALERARDPEADSRARFGPNYDRLFGPGGEVEQARAAQDADRAMRERQLQRLAEPHRPSPNQPMLDVADLGPPTRTFRMTEADAARAGMTPAEIAGARYVEDPNNPDVQRAGAGTLPPIIHSPAEAVPQATRDAHARAMQQIFEQHEAEQQARRQTNGMLGANPSSQQVTQTMDALQQQHVRERDSMYKWVQEHFFRNPTAAELSSVDRDYSSRRQTLQRLLSDALLRERRVGQPARGQAGTQRPMTEAQMSTMVRHHMDAVLRANQKPANRNDAIDGPWVPPHPDVSAEVRRRVQVERDAVHSLMNPPAAPPGQLVPNQLEQERRLQAGAAQRPTGGTTPQTPAAPVQPTGAPSRPLSAIPREQWSPDQRAQMDSFHAQRAQIDRALPQVDPNHPAMTRQDADGERNRVGVARDQQMRAALHSWVDEAQQLFDRWHGFAGMPPEALSRYRALYRAVNRQLDPVRIERSVSEGERLRLTRPMMRR